MKCLKICQSARDKLSLIYIINLSGLYCQGQISYQKVENIYFDNKMCYKIHQVL